MGTLRARGEGAFELRVYAGREGGRDKYVSETFRGTERAARKALARLEVEVDDRRAPGPGQGKVAGLLEDWHASHPWRSAGSRQVARQHLDAYLIPILGPIDLLKFSDRDLDRFYAGLASGKLSKSGRPLAASSIVRLHATLHAALAWGVRKRRLRANPAATANRPAVAPSAVEAPELVDVRKIISAAPSAEFQVFLVVAAATGRRREDLLGLQLPDLDLDGGEVRFSRRVVYTPATGVVVEALDKNYRASRVSIDRATSTALRDHLWRMEERALTCGATLHRRAFVFSDDPEGRRAWHPDSTSRRFRTVCERLGLEGVTLHTLRHAHITELLTAGVDVETVAHRVGDDPRTVYKFYSHFRPAADRRAADTWGEITGGLLHSVRPQG